MMKSPSAAERMKAKNHPPQEKDFQPTPVAMLNAPSREPAVTTTRNSPHAKKEDRRMVTQNVLRMENVHAHQEKQLPCALILKRKANPSKAIVSRQKPMTMQHRTNPEKCASISSFPTVAFAHDAKPMNSSRWG
jgi:hypothetical protein